MAGAPAAGLEGGFLQAVWVAAPQSILVIDSWLRGFASPGSASILALKILVKNALGRPTSMASGEFASPLYFHEARVCDSERVDKSYKMTS